MIFHLFSRIACDCCWPTVPPNIDNHFDDTGAYGISDSDVVRSVVTVWIWARIWWSYTHENTGGWCLGCWARKKLATLINGLWSIHNLWLQNTISYLYEYEIGAKAIEIMVFIVRHGIAKNLLMEKIFPLHFSGNQQTLYILNIATNHSIFIDLNSMHMNIKTKEKNKILHTR